MPSFFSSPTLVFSAAVVLRLALLTYGHYQDEHSALKYTDIDYYVFTDAARYVSWGKSPYLRDTYRYTPLLAWMLIPTTWGGLWFDFGKALFALSDILAGWLVYSVLRSTYQMPRAKALKFASLWLLNPMVAQISTRGSSEGLLAVMVTALLWAVLKKRSAVAGVLLGVSVHFKIYPFIYGASILLSLQAGTTTKSRNILSVLFAPGAFVFILASVLTFLILNVWMLLIYGKGFLQHTYLYHLIRTDHRHNFSPYNMLLYLNSSPAGSSGFHPETFAFLPQLCLSVIAIPLALAEKDLVSCMLAQTFCFVTFNKVCTSQYFLWYLIFLPYYLPTSSFLREPLKGWIALGFWVVGQLFWLQQGYQLEFLGRSTFLPGLWLANILFFAVDIGILGIVISDTCCNLQNGKMVA